MKADFTSSPQAGTHMTCVTCPGVVSKLLLELLYDCTAEPNPAWSRCSAAHFNAERNARTVFCTPRQQGFPTSAPVTAKWPLGENPWSMWDSLQKGMLLSQYPNSLCHTHTLSAKPVSLGTKKFPDYSGPQSSGSDGNHRVPQGHRLISGEVPWTF